MKSANHMKQKPLTVVFASLILIGGFLPPATFAQTLDEACTAIANRLMAEQIQQGDKAGTWTSEADFTGSIVAGMMAACEMSSRDAWMASAELGGDYILRSAEGNFYGDEAYALTRLSEAAADPCDNAWRTAVESFYATVSAEYPGGTMGYIEDYGRIDHSTAVFYIANHVVAACYVDAADKEIWRQGLIESLCGVDDSCLFPVMGLGVATWALALTGPLDKTPIMDPVGQGAAYWTGSTLQDLPHMLMSRQVPEGRQGAGGFYWLFGQVDGDPNGWTEDTIFATLGLTAAARTSSDPKLDSAILAAREALLSGVAADGRVWELLSQQGAVYFVYAGEMLQALEALSLLSVPADINKDGQVDLTDFQILIARWGSSNCEEPSWCDGADINRDGQVDAADLGILLEFLPNQQASVSDEASGM
ncbi:MAG: hypothetical protein A2Z25_15215 [Planctomycetes bacterium RBG_16_55_9]|nr:MAG: hypothetical protein A2Z25_15215 [Planctomycetes bacterium RBG_16_55_9]